MFNKEKPVSVKVDEAKCVKCGVCTEICDTYLKKDANGFPQARENDDKENLFGCIQCGNCMMICPTDAIEVIGEDIDKNHLRELTSNLPDYEALNALFLKRRSCRKFKQEEVSKEDIERIINSAATAAVSLPPSEVKVMVIQGRKKVQEMADDLLNTFRNFTKKAPLILPIIKLFAGKTNYKMFKEFVFPLGKVMIESRNEGQDILFYDAPCLIIFYGTELTDKEDMHIAATQATLAAEALGLGTCIIGSVGAILQTDKKLRKKYEFEKGDKIGMGFVLGHPDVKFKKAFQRKFKEVKYI